jgi:hypothetical protein
MEEIWKLYKTKPCKSVFRNQPCAQPKQCKFFHDEKDRRRTLNFKYKPVICIDALLTDACNHDFCKCCRNYIEYLYHPLNFKVNECIFMKRKIPCSIDPNLCPGYHSQQEKQYYDKHRANYDVTEDLETSGYESESEPEIKAFKSSEELHSAANSGIRENSIQHVVQINPFTSKAGRAYILGKEIPKFEDRFTEFKSFSSFNLKGVIEVLANYISGFLNTEGGTLFYGVRDDGVVIGIKLTRKQRDQLSCTLDSCLNNFRPHISPDNVKIEFIEVMGKDGKLLHDLYVMEVKVRKGNTDEIYFTHKKEAYIKRDASISLLSPPDLLNFYQQRIKSKH